MKLLFFWLLITVFSFQIPEISNNILETPENNTEITENIEVVHSEDMPTCQSMTFKDLENRLGDIFHTAVDEEGNCIGLRDFIGMIKDLPEGKAMPISYDCESVSYLLICENIEL